MKKSFVYNGTPVKFKRNFKHKGSRKILDVLVELFIAKGDKCQA